jgi:hypothetical protein
MPLKGIGNEMDLTFVGMNGQIQASIKVAGKLQAFHSRTSFDL